MKLCKFKLMSTIIIILIFIVGCSNNESSSGNQTDNNDSDEVDTNDNGESEDPAKAENGTDEEKKTNSDIPSKHQLGLSIEESGVVENEIGKYKLTINEIRMEEELGDLFIITNFTIENIDDENIDDENIDLANIFTPVLSVAQTDNPLPPEKQEYLEGINEITLVEGELAPGETTEGDFVFDIEQSEGYILSFGKASSQIITRAEWEFSADEIN